MDFIRLPSSMRAYWYAHLGSEADVLELWIVPQQSSFGLRRVRRVDLIKDLGVILQRAISVRKAARHEHLFALLGGQDCRHVAAIARGISAEVHRKIEDRAAHRAHELR